LEVWLINAEDVKHLPGRLKTDQLDAVWLAKLAERDMLRPSIRAGSSLSQTCSAVPHSPLGDGEVASR
jgi:hypothetical protein